MYTAQNSRGSQETTQSVQPELIRQVAAIVYQNQLFEDRANSIKQLVGSIHAWAPPESPVKSLPEPKADLSTITNNLDAQIYCMSKNNEKLELILLHLKEITS